MQYVNLAGMARIWILRTELLTVKQKFLLKRADAGDIGDGSDLKKKSLDEKVKDVTSFLAENPKYEPLRGILKYIRSENWPLA